MASLKGRDIFQSAQIRQDMGTRLQLSLFILSFCIGIAVTHNVRTGTQIDCDFCKWVVEEIISCALQIREEKIDYVYNKCVEKWDWDTDKVCPRRFPLHSAPDASFSVTISLPLMLFL